MCKWWMDGEPQSNAIQMVSVAPSDKNKLCIILVTYLESYKYGFFPPSSSSISFSIYVYFYGFFFVLCCAGFNLSFCGRLSFEFANVSSQLACGFVSYVFVCMCENALFFRSSIFSLALAVPTFANAKLRSSFQPFSRLNCGLSFRVFPFLQFLRFKFIFRLYYV